MMKDPLKNLCIRNGIVWQRNAGYLLACDPKKEDDEPHARIIMWHEGSFSESWVQFNAHAICRIAEPERGLVFLSADGLYAVHSQTSNAGNVYEDSEPPANDPRYGSFRALGGVDGKAYAVGLRGMVYCLETPQMWTRLDEGLSREFDAQAIHGFGAADLYVVGFAGEMWHFDGDKWEREDLPTNVNLTSVLCAEDGLVYAAGHNGVLLHGKRNAWEIIEHDATSDDIWDLEWFDGRLCVSTLASLFQLNEERDLEQVEFGDDSPRSFYRVSAADGVLWSIGEFDVMSFDGTAWTRIV